MRRKISREVKNASPHAGSEGVIRQAAQLRLAGPRDLRPRCHRDITADVAEYIRFITVEFAAEYARSKGAPPDPFCSHCGRLFSVTDPLSDDLPVEPTTPW